MAEKCIITKKKTSFGNNVSMRGIAKKKKGIGLKKTASSRRTFKVNSFKKKLWSSSLNRMVTVRLSAKGLKTIDERDVAEFI